MSLKSIKIGLAVHSAGHIDPKAYANHIAVFSQWCKKYSLIFFHLDGAKVAEARNILVDWAMDHKCTHILFIDDDHIIDCSLLPCLLGNTDAAVVSGIVTKRSGQGPQVGFLQADEDMSYTVTLPLSGFSYFVDACAFGCTLIDIKVFDLLERPFFKDVILRNKEGKLYQRRSDMHFCRELRDQGVMIKIDTRAVIGHLGKKPVYYPENRIFQVATYQKVAELVKEKTNPKILDLGCGFANNLFDLIKPICSNITGVDKKDITAFCKNKDKDLNWITYNLEEEGFFGEFDIVICADVLEHMNHPEILLQTINRSLKNGAHAIISTPDISTVGDDVVINKDHQTGWNKETFTKFLSSKLNVVDVTSHFEIVNYESLVVICKKKE